jgi:hypothetical protein
VVQGVGNSLRGGERVFQKGGRSGSFWWREIVRICDGVGGLGVSGLGSACRKR